MTNNPIITTQKPTAPNHRLIPFFIYSRIQHSPMARSDSFFIRAKLSALTGGAGGFTTENIDLGSFVDALGKTVLRIHNVSVQYTYGAFVAPSIAAGNDEGITSWQITTQNQTAMVDASNRTLISSGALVAANNSAVGNTVTFVSQDIDVSPQKWQNGYLIAVESIQLAGQSSANFTSTCDVSVVLECTVETMTAAASMALALSQQ
ncbi:MAG: hypothetical protein [Circular genetic element sp.]|nr:MAG: hypothetical protein [Circular genetic element sp.]